MAEQIAENVLRQGQQQVAKWIEHRRLARKVKLYERLGFSRVGVYHEQGMLDGHWVDTLIMEKLL